MRIDAGFKLSDDQRLSLYTLMHQWSRNTDLQFNQVISWIEEATQLALAAAPPDPRKDLEALERLVNECGAVLAFEHELREISVLGNTNVNVFKLRVQEARAALADRPK